MMTAVISVIDSEIKENWQIKCQNILDQKMESLRRLGADVNPEIRQSVNGNTPK